MLVVSIGRAPRRWPAGPGRGRYVKGTVRADSTLQTECQCVLHPYVSMIDGPRWRGTVRTELVSAALVRRGQWPPPARRSKPELNL